MNLHDQLHDHLNRRLAGADDTEPIVVTDGKTTVRCDLAAAEKIGCTLREVGVTDRSGHPLSMDELVWWSEWMCGRVTYLFEPLQLIEVDRAHGLAVIRSKRPRRRDDGITYFELVADRKREASIKRYRSRAGRHGRFACEFPLTHEQIDVLVEDMAEGARLPGLARRS